MTKLPLLNRTNPSYTKQKWLSLKIALLLTTILLLPGCFSYAAPTPMARGNDQSTAASDTVDAAEPAALVVEEAAAEDSAVDMEIAMDEAEGDSGESAAAASVLAIPQSASQAKTADSQLPQSTVVANAVVESAPARDREQAPADMFFQDYGVNPFLNTADDNLSTFAMDVDTGSYTIVRNYLRDGLLPPVESVRVEEYVNYFDYDYAMPTQDEVFAIQIESTQAPFADIVDAAGESQAADVRTVRVGIQGYEISADERQDVALTFVVDVSGSMDQENRMTLAKRALNMLVEELRPTDSVAIIAYGDSAYTILPPTPASEKNTIVESIFSLIPGGSTNAEAGLTLGYETAWETFEQQMNNRLVLISDGVANVGETTPGSIWHQVEQYADRGITLTSIGVGMGNYNDVLLEQLADMGDGTYAYVDTIDEARRIFVDELTGTLQTIAKDAKVQVEFNQELVSAYRLVGYENRDVADSDFRNDAIDAGEIGAGHSVTALYEVIINPEVAQSNIQNDALLTVSLRWLDPQSGEPTEIAQSHAAEAEPTRFVDAAPDFQLAIAVAEYAEVLRASQWSATSDVTAQLADEIMRIGSLMQDDEKVAEFVDLVEQAERMAMRQ